MEPPKEIRNCTVNFQCPKLWKRLTYYHNGVNRRLTDVHGEVIKEILS